MCSLLGQFISRERLRQGLSRAEVATRSGYRNIAKGSNRLCSLERDGIFDELFLAKIIGALNIDQSKVEELLEADRQIAAEVWNEWADQPITPHLIVKVGGAAYRRELPPDIASFEDGVEHLKQFCIEGNTRACLVWSRRQRAWGRPDGTGFLEDVTPDDRGGPGMSLPGSSHRFVLAGS